MELPHGIRMRRLEIDRGIVDRARPVLSREECVRLDGFRSDRRRLSFAAGRLAARELLSEQLGCDPGSVLLEVRDDESVGLPDDSLHLSISHSGQRAVAVTAPGPVGADVEQVYPRPVSLYRFMLHPDEFRLVDATPLSDDEKLVLFWALKEAVLKGRRTGLRQSPKNLRLGLDLDSGGARIETPGDDPDWHARFELGTEYVTTVAWPDPAR